MVEESSVDITVLLKGLLVEGRKESPVDITAEEPVDITLEGKPVDITVECGRAYW